MAEKTVREFPHLEFREEFWNILTTIRDDIALGEKFPRRFSSDTDPEPPCINDLFEYTGLDVNAPGHWQLLQHAMFYCYAGRAERSRTRWNRESEKRLVRRALDQMKSAPDIPLSNETAIEKTIWPSLKETYSEEYKLSAVSLRVKFFEAMRMFRNLKEEQIASNEEVSLLDQYEKMQRKRRTVGN